MSRREKIKSLLVILPAVYGAYTAYKRLKEGERQEDERKRRRLTELKRSRDFASSSSEDEEYLIPPSASYSTFLNEVNTTEPKTQSTSQNSNSAGQANPNSHKRKRFSPGTINGKFVDTVVAKFSEEQFKKHFRVTRKTIYNLHDRFRNSAEYASIFHVGDTPKIPAKYYMMMFLWFTGKRCSFMELGKVFNVSLSRSVCIVETVVSFLNNCAGEYIRLPATPAERRASAEDFEKIAEFPDVIGCLLTTQFEVQVPQNEIEGSASYKKVQLNVQAICDSKGRFLNVFFDTSGAPKQDVLHTSPVNAQLRDACGGRYHVLASGEYKIREWVLIPYRKRISEEQKMYNERHQRTREAVAASLDILKRRFEQISNMRSLSIAKAVKLITACCVVQNIALQEGDGFEVADPLAISPNVSVKAQDLSCLFLDNDDPILKRMGELKRKDIVENMKVE